MAYGCDQRKIFECGTHNALLNLLLCHFQNRDFGNILVDNKRYFRLCRAIGNRPAERSQKMSMLFDAAFELRNDGVFNVTVELGSIRTKINGRR